MRRSVRSRIYTRPDSPFWWAEYTPTGGADPVRQSTGCRDHATARAWLATRELERVKAGAGLPVARPIELTRALAEYLSQKKPEWSDGYYITVEGQVTNRVVPWFGGGRSVATITRADIEAFRASEMGHPARLSRCCKRSWVRVAEGWGCALCAKPPPADFAQAGNATNNRLLASLAAFGRWCLVEGRGYHTTNPWAGHEPLPEDQTPIPDVPAKALQAVLRALDDPGRFRFAWRTLVEFARETGLRKGELGRMRWEDLRLEERVAWLPSTRRRGHTKARKMRPVILSALAVQLLESLPRRIDGAVFGKVPDPRRAMKTAARAAGVPRLWLHLFRHLFASRLAERGAGRHELRDAAGWSSSRMADRYTHARLERLRELVEEPQGQVEKEEQAAWAAASADRQTASASHVRRTLGPGRATGGPE
jgi:integrase